MNIANIIASAGGAGGAALFIIGTILIVVVAVALTGIRQVSQSQIAVVERLGKFHKVLRPGLNFIIPFFDQQKYVAQVNYTKEGISKYRIDVREQVMDIPKQEVITKDNIRMHVDTLVFYQVIDPEKACYEISAPVDAIRRISQTTTRNIFGEMELDTTLSARESINDRLRSTLDEATDKWGIKVVRVEIQEIDPPPELKEAMQKQMVAERSRREQVTHAQAEKQAAIERAEGEKASNVLQAEGENRAMILAAEAEKQKRILEAEGRAESIRMVQEATARGLEAVRSVLRETSGSQGLLVIEALKAQVSVAEKLAASHNTKLFLPNNIAGLYGTIDGVREMLNLKFGDATDPALPNETPPDSKA